MARDVLCSPDETYQKALSYIRRSHPDATEIYLNRQDLKEVGRDGNYKVDSQGNDIIDRVSVAYAFKGQNGQLVVGTQWVSAYNCHTSGTGEGQSGAGAKITEELHDTSN